MTWALILWLNVEPLKRVSTPLFGRHVRCSVHGCSLVRLMVVSLIVNLHQTTRLIFNTGICPTPMILTSFLYRQNASTAVHEKNTSIKYWRRAALIPQRTGTGAALAPRMKTRYIPIRARQRLMRICSCSFWRRFLK